jgi:tRNA threonylcarbamoyladenosine biosynthesis protein TsaB
MKILALEFSSSRRSVALAECTPMTVQPLGRAEEQHGQSTHAFAMIDSMLEQAGVSRDSIAGLAIGLGPGSYAGIRVALAIAQGWQLATGINTLGVSSVRCLAEGARRSGHRGPASFVIDAQRGEFYLADYSLSDTGCTEITPLAILNRGAVEQRLKTGVVVFGPDLSTLLPGSTPLHPEAAILAEFAGRNSDFVPANQLEPIYLRAVNFVKAPKPSKVY